MSDCENNGCVPNWTQSTHNIAKIVRTGWVCLKTIFIKTLRI
jgi:hypothetical protein